MNARFAGLVLTLGLVVACGGDDGGDSEIDAGGDFEISEETLSGQVGGQDWTFVRGDTNAFLSEGEDEFFAKFYAEDFTPCESSPPGSDSLIVSVPKEPGEYSFSLMLNMTFVTGGENLVATRGWIVVDTVDETTVTGGLYGNFDGDNEVSGQFEITICSGAT